MKVKAFAIRGRYNKDGSTSQQIEFRKDDVTNTLTTVLKDNMILEIVGGDELIRPNCFTEMRTEEAKQQRREHRAKYGTDFSPRRGKVAVLRTDEVANCLVTSPTIEQTIALPIGGEYGMTTLTVNDFFCGAGGMGIGFKNAGFRLGGAWDFDKYAVESYGHNVSPKVKQADITQMTIEDVPNSDVWTFGFPCQDISNAGKQAGMIKGVTRSGLFYEVMRLLDETTDKPKIILAENVKAVKKYLPEIEKEYAERGYKFYAVLYNSKYWGVPQNRERYFMIGVHESIEKEFVFPAQQTEFVPRLSSILEPVVDEKFYLNRPMHPFIMDGDISVIGTTAMSVVREDGSVIKDKSTSAWVHDTDKRIGTLAARDYKQPKQIIEPRIRVIGEVDMKGMDVIKRVYDQEGLSPILTTSAGGHRQPKILKVGNTGETDHSGGRIYSDDGIAPTILSRDYKGAIKVLTEPKIMNVGNVNPSGRGMNGQVIHTDGLASTLTTNKGEGIKVLNDHRIRKLTPREYARLQGFPDSFELVVSNSQAYKQFGNA